MAASSFDGPLFVSGNLSTMQAVTFGTTLSDPNPDRGPSLFYDGTGLFDVRYWYGKDQIQGYTGVAAGHLGQSLMTSASGIPAALAANNIAAAQTVASGVAMTLAGASVGVAINLPVRQPNGVLNNGPIVTAALAVDFGFAYGNCTAGNATITVADGRDFSVGMPLVIGGVGNSAGTAPLLTLVTAVVASAATNTITVTIAPSATNATAPIGTGDLWGPNETGYPTPVSASPMLATGPALVFDPRQGIARGVQINGVAGSTGGTFTVRGMDIWGVPMSQTVTVAAGASAGYSLKCFKYFLSVTPNFTDASHNYTVGTSDVFDFHYRSRIWEKTQASWAGTEVTSSTGWVTADLTIIATALTGDTCGTLQVSTTGGGSPVTTAAASNGTIVSLAMSGRRLELGQFLATNDVLAATSTNPAPTYGSTQA
jgi:hypothetical protein